MRPSENSLITEFMTDEQREWLAKLHACVSKDAFDLNEFEKLPSSPFPPPAWINKHSAVIGNAYGRQLVTYRDPATGTGIEISLIVIPKSRLEIKSIQDLEDWDMYWDEPHSGAKREVTKANGSLCIERHVRTNVTRRKFLSWRLENPRFFITERELVYWIRKGVLLLQFQPHRLMAVN
jgi:hypothetical protein